MRPLISSILYRKTIINVNVNRRGRNIRVREVAEGGYSVL